MPIQRIRAGVQLAVGKPPVKRWIGVVEHTPRLTDPRHCPRGAGPERRRIFDAFIETPRYSPISALFDVDEYPEFIVLLDISSVLVLVGSGHDHRGLLECINIDGRSMEPPRPCPSAKSHQSCSGPLVQMELVGDHDGSIQSKQSLYAAMELDAWTGTSAEPVTPTWPQDHRFEDFRPPIKVFGLHRRCVPRHSVIHRTTDTCFRTTDTFLSFETVGKIDHDCLRATGC